MLAPLGSLRKVKGVRWVAGHSCSSSTSCFADLSIRNWSRKERGGEEKTLGFLLKGLTALPEPLPHALL